MKKKLSTEQRSWIMYDFANSSFATTIMAGFFPVFFKTYLSSGVDAAVSTARLGTILSLAGLTVALISPVLGTISDRRSLKKEFCFIFMLLGVFSAFGMGFLAEGAWMAAALLYGLGQVGFNGSCTFYDSLLPAVAKNKEMNYVSALGFSFGYLGGAILFILNVLCFLNHEALGISQATAVKIAFISVGIWWLVFSIPLFKNVKELSVPTPKNATVLEMFFQSFGELKRTILRIAKDRNLLFFIIAFWFYIDGVYTVFTMAVDFGMSIGLESKDLITALIITQVVGFPSAWLFGYYSRNRNCKPAIFFCIFVYSISLILARGMDTALHFYLLASIIGVVQGGIQSLSRSLFARMIPAEKSGEYFGFFNLVGRFAAILGPAIISIHVSITSDSRSSMMSLLVLFALGSLFLVFVKEPKSEG